MAAAEPFQAKPDASPDAIPADGSGHVFRAGGLEAAGWGQQRRDPTLV